MSVGVPLVVSLSRMRKVPLALPLESSCLSASFRPSLPKYQLQGGKEAGIKLWRAMFGFHIFLSAILAVCATEQPFTKGNETSSQIFMFLRDCVWLFYSPSQKKKRKKKRKFYSLLSLYGVHRSNVIAGNVTSSTCGEGASLPPVALTGEKEREREREKRGRMMEAASRQINARTLCRRAQINTRWWVIRFIGCLVTPSGGELHKNKHLKQLFSSVWAPPVNHPSFKCGWNHIQPSSLKSK